MTSVKPYRCWAEIDLAALERNIGRIRAALPQHIRYVGVVKADAYGHGARQMATRLMQSGADAFAVANVHEAAELRELGAGWPILILSAILPHEESRIVDYNLTPTISTSEEVARFNALAEKRKQTIPVHLKIDTGMGRLGVWHEEAVELYNQIIAADNLKLEGIFTHFSCADGDADFTANQRQTFLDVLAKLPDLDVSKLLIHADNSAGLETFTKDSPFNAVRIGLLQFGLLPYPDSLLSKLKAEPVLSFHTRVGVVKNLPKGTHISYGATHTLKRDTRIAVLTAGYGDGIPTSCSNRASVLIRGQRCPILGRVTMDQVIVDATDLPEVATGDLVTLIGTQESESIQVAEFAKWANSIPWEIFCSITKRVARVYATDRVL